MDFSIIGGPREHIVRIFEHYEVNDLGWEKKAPAVDESPLSDEGGDSYMRKYSKDLRGSKIPPCSRFRKGSRSGAG